MTNVARATLSATILAAVTITGCSNASPCPGAYCIGVGGDFACSASRSCAHTCDDSCNLACGDAGSCDWTCGPSCNVSCPAGSDCLVSAGPSSNVSCDASTCDVTLGASSNISCTENAGCVIRCQGSCNVDCRTADSCRLTCTGAAERDVAGTTATCG